MTTTHPAPDSPAVDPAIATAVYEQACENVRHIRNERIWYGNIYVAVIAGGLASLPRDVAEAQNRRLATIVMIVLLLFSLASLLSSIRLVAELRQALRNLHRVVEQQNIGRLTGPVMLGHGVTSSLPVRWVFPIFYASTTVSLAVLLIEHLRG